MYAKKIRESAADVEAQLTAQNARVADAQAAVEKAKADLKADVDAGRDYAKSEERLSAASQKLATVTATAKLTAEAVETKRRALDARLSRERAESIRAEIPQAVEAQRRAEEEAAKAGLALSEALSKRDRAAGSLSLLAGALRQIGEPEPVIPTPDIDRDIEDLFRSRHAKAINTRDGFTPAFGTISVTVPVLVAAHAENGFLPAVIAALNADREAASVAAELAELS